MGRGSYNGGSPVVNIQKKTDIDVSNGVQDTPALPKGFRNLGSGEGSQNERGGKQAEFGFLVGAKKVEVNTSVSKLSIRKRKEAKEYKAEYQ